MTAFSAIFSSTIFKSEICCYAAKKLRYSVIKKKSELPKANPVKEVNPMV